MKRKLIVVLGPTASGKTEFSVRLAKMIERIEIINADSRQLYASMDIGTAKIRSEDMHDIPHHLLSVLDPKTQANIGWYKKEAMRVIDEIHARGSIPMLVGGSMLYISSIIDGLKPNPYRRSGGPPSTVKSPCPYDLSIIGLEVPRQELCRRINERTRTLLNSGWIEEVEGLLKMGYSVEDPGFMACGYREIANKIKNEKCKMKSDLYEEIAAKTRQYAKRQLCWWKRDTRIMWVNPATWLVDRSQKVFNLR